MRDSYDLPLKDNETTEFNLITSPRRNYEDGDLEKALKEIRQGLAGLPGICFFKVQGMRVDRQRGKRRALFKSTMRSRTKATKCLIPAVLSPQSGKQVAN